MARPRTHHDEKKQGIIQISFELFMKNGYEGTSIQDIMKAAQISKGAMYHYFTCKEDILDAVLNYIIDLDKQRLEPILNDSSLTPLQKLMGAMLSGPQPPSEEVRQAAEYVMQRPASIFDYRARELSRARSIPSIANLIREGVDAGEFHTQYPEEMAEVMYSAAQSIGELTEQPVDMAVLRRKIDAFAKLLIYCLGLEKKDQDILLAFFNDSVKPEQAQRHDNRPNKFNVD